MLNFVFELARISSRSRLLWLVPAFVFILLLATRLSSLMATDTYMLHFMYYTALFISVFVYFIFIYVFIKILFPSHSELKGQVIFYKKMGYGFMEQFFNKVIMSLFFSFIFWLLCSFILWDFSYRLLLVLLFMNIVLLLLRTASVYFNASLVYYIFIVLLILSVFYPVYIVPNPAYVYKGGLMDVIHYLLAYFILYAIIAYRTFVSSWKKECIGWI